MRNISIDLKLLRCPNGGFCTDQAPLPGFCASNPRTQNPKTTVNHSVDSIVQLCSISKQKCAERVKTFIILHGHRLFIMYSRCRPLFQLHFQKQLFSKLSPGISMTQNWYFSHCHFRFTSLINNRVGTRF